MESIKKSRIRDTKAYKPSKRVWFGVFTLIGLTFTCFGVFRVFSAEEVQAPDVAIISAGILFTGVIVAFENMRQTRLERTSQTYHQEAKDLFKAAYEALKIDTKTNFPINSRQNYLNCARLLMAAQRLQSMIPLEADKAAAKEIEQLWRFRFNELLFSRSSFDTEESEHTKSIHPWNDRYYFFQEGRLMCQTPEDRSPISLESLGVIVRFMDWPDDMPNQLSSVPKLTYEEVESRWFDPVEGLKEYIKRTEAPSSFQDTSRRSS